MSPLLRRADVAILGYIPARPLFPGFYVEMKGGKRMWKIWMFVYQLAGGPGCALFALLAIAAVVCAVLALIG